MTQPGYGKVYPFEGSNQAGDAEWRKLAGAWGDGIVNDGTGLAFNAVPSATDRTIVVQIHELRMRGIDLEEIPVSGADPTTTITLSSPSAGNTRCDRIVARYDPSVPSISVIPVEGSPVSTGVAQPAALLRNPGGTWDLALWQFTGGNVVASQLVKLDERTWVGAFYVVPTSAALLDQHANAAIGSHAITLDNQHEWLRRLVASTPTWVDLDAPGYLAFPLIDTTALIPWDPAYPLLYGKERGWVNLTGAVKRSSGNLIQSGNADVLLGTLPVGCRPGTQCGFSVMSEGGAQPVRCLVQPSGKVYLASDGINVQGAALDNVRFYATQ